MHAEAHARVRLPSQRISKGRARGGQWRDSTQMPRKSAAGRKRRFKRLACSRSLGLLPALRVSLRPCCDLGNVLRTACGTGSPKIAACGGFLKGREGGKGRGVDSPERPTLFWQRHLPVHRPLRRVVQKTPAIAARPFICCAVRRFLLRPFGVLSEMNIGGGRGVVTALRDFDTGVDLLLFCLVPATAELLNDAAVSRLMLICSTLRMRAR